MTPPLHPLLEPTVFIWLVLMGASVGSFLNVCVFRIPRRCLSVSEPARSFCPRCRYAIPWHQNLPVLSWLLLRGRCASCRQPIALRYPLVELATALLFAWLAWRDVLGRMDEPGAWGLFLAHVTFGCALLVLALIDLDLRILPDAITVPGIVLAPLAACAAPELLVGGAPDLVGGARWAVLRLESPLTWWGTPGALGPLEALAEAQRGGAALHAGGLIGALAGAAFGASFVWALGVVVTAAVGREAMGFGDVKLMAVIGGLLGWRGVALTLALACLVGTVGGLVHLLHTGRGQLTEADAERARRTALGALGLRLTGVASGVHITPPRPGTGWIARLLTGDPTVPFGPFLAIGAAVVAFAPPGVIHL